MKQKIENRKQLSDFFRRVNEEVDKFIIEYNIKPSRLTSFIKKNGGLTKFIEEIGLSDIDGIDRVVAQVLKSRVNMEKDGIMKFESFRLLESVDSEKVAKHITISEIISGIKPSSISHERALADIFDVSLGHIVELDTKAHKYEVTDISGKFEVIIFSEEDHNIMFDNLDEFILKNMPDEVVINITHNNKIRVPISADENKSNNQELDLENVLLDIYTEHEIKDIGWKNNHTVLFKKL